MSDYWQSTKSPVHLFPRAYETAEVAKQVSDNAFVDSAIISQDLRKPHLNPQAVAAYQRRIGVRKIANPRVKRDD